MMLSTTYKKVDHYKRLQARFVLHPKRRTAACQGLNMAFGRSQKSIFIVNANKIAQHSCIHALLYDAQWHDPYRAASTTCERSLFLPSSNLCVEYFSFFHSSSDGKQARQIVDTPQLPVNEHTCPSSKTSIHESIHFPEHTCSNDTANFSMLQFG